MPRPSGPKVRCNNQWTEARYTTFVKNLIRSGSRKWGPTQLCIKKARVERGIYLCANCHEHVPATIVVEGLKGRTKNILVDHIAPVIDPHVGFTTWDSYIAGIFCEEDNLQIICRACHLVKTKEETDIATERRRREKEDA